MLTDIQRWFIVTAACVVVIAPSLGAQTLTGQDHTGTAESVIEVPGHGEIRVMPDRATVSLSVETKGSLAATVAAANARVQRRVLDTLKALGYSGAQVSTVGYNVQPNYETVANATEPRQAGYVSRNTVEVTVSPLDRVGPVIDAALARGANGVQDIGFAASNTEAPRQSALAQAAANARADAAVLAKSMGGTLGRLVSITVDGTPGYPRAFALETRGPGPVSETPVSPGEITVAVSVIARWQFVAP